MAKYFFKIIDIQKPRNKILAEIIEYIKEQDATLFDDVKSKIKFINQLNEKCDDLNYKYKGALPIHISYWTDQEDECDTPVNLPTAFSGMIYQVRNTVHNIPLTQIDIL